jgi:hypothetical protein
MVVPGYMAYKKPAASERVIMLFRSRKCADCVSLASAPFTANPFNDSQAAVNLPDDASDCATLNGQCDDNGDLASCELRLLQLTASIRSSGSLAVENPG